MRRLRVAFIASALALAGPVAAAEITRVASSADRYDPFDLDLSVRYERFQERATITREGALDELRFVRTRHAFVPRITVGLFHDLEFHVEMPYVLADDRSWRFGDVYGKPSGGVPPYSSIEKNDIDASGDPVTEDRDPAIAGDQVALFGVAGSPTVYHGGMMGDLKAGLGWAVFNNSKDDTKPTWVVGTDVTFPTAKVYEPAKDRSRGGPGTWTWGSPYTKADPGPFGEKVWKLDVYTALSKRLGVIDPYVKAHGTKMFKSSSTFSNCDFAQELTDPALPALQMNKYAAANCATWGSEADAKPPWLAGLVLGTELVPYEDVSEGQKVSFDLRLFAEYTSPQRFYNELTDATGKIHQTGRYVTVGGLFGLYLRASEYVMLQTTASLSTRSAHYLTGESPGWSGSTLPADTSSINPNFDWRYDAPGRRFRISEVSIFEIAASGVIQF